MDAPFLFMQPIKINVEVDLGHLLAVTRYAERNRPLLLQTAANRYLRYLEQRYLRLGPPLKDSTIASKKSRGSDTPEAVMRESDHTRSQLSTKVVKQQIFVGYVRNSKVNRPSKKIGTTFALVKMHRTVHAGGLNPARPIVVQPSEGVKKRMVEDIKNDYNKLIRRFRRRK